MKTSFEFVVQAVLPFAILPLVVERTPPLLIVDVVAILVPVKAPDDCKKETSNLPALDNFILSLPSNLNDVCKAPPALYIEVSPLLLISVKSKVLIPFVVLKFCCVDIVPVVETKPPVAKVNWRFGIFKDDILMVLAVRTLVFTF